MTHGTTDPFHTMAVLDHPPVRVDPRHVNALPIVLMRHPPREKRLRPSSFCEQKDNQDTGASGKHVPKFHLTPPSGGRSDLTGGPGSPRLCHLSLQPAWGYTVWSTLRRNGGAQPGMRRGNAGTDHRTMVADPCEGNTGRLPLRTALERVGDPPCGCWKRDASPCRTEHVTTPSPPARWTTNCQAGTFAMPSAASRAVPRPLHQAAPPWPRSHRIVAARCLG